MKVVRAPSKLAIPPHATRVFKGIMFDVYHWQQEMFDGSSEIFEKLVRTDTVTVLPTTNDKKIIITYQEQPATKPFIGSIGGRIDVGEAPLEAAKRELLEEAGMVSDRWEFYKSMQPSGVIDWAIFTFIAKNCRSEQEQMLDSGEKIKLKAVSFDEFIEIIVQPNYRDYEISLAFLKAIKNNTLNEMKKLLFD